MKRTFDNVLDAAFAIKDMADDEVFFAAPMAPYMGHCARSRLQQEYMLATASNQTSRGIQLSIKKRAALTLDELSMACIGCGEVLDFHEWEAVKTVLT